jgi:hypothetical protein
MAGRISLADQLETIERLLKRAKAEHDWPTIAPTTFGLSEVFETEIFAG